MQKGKKNTLKNNWKFDLYLNRSDSFTYWFVRVSLITFIYPTFTALVVISLLDSFTGNDMFAIGAVRAIERKYVSNNIKNIALVTFDRNILSDSKLPESREDIIQLAVKLVEGGARLVVLDYVFRYGKDTPPIPKSLTNKIIVGSSIEQIGSKFVEIIPPKNLLPDEVLMGNWGDISLYDTEDKYGAVNSLVYYYENNDLYLSLALAAYNRALNGQSNQELKNHGKRIPLGLLKNSRYWLTVPSNIHELDSRTYSAWTFEYDLMMGAADIQDKTVFVASTWDISEDHFYIGSDSTNSFFKRILIWAGLSTSNGKNGKEPGVYAHISAYLNLLDGKIYKHTSVENQWTLPALAPFIIAIIIYITTCILYRHGISRVINNTKSPVLSFSLATVTALMVIVFTLFYSTIVINWFNISLSLTPWVISCIYIIVIITAKELDNVKFKNN
ncbi:CHASE2 domain-containing protein [Shewanella sp. AS16]|uniref:CHASE2 domain-containing protein n=1 Tax=Shewanella sp. AS16 TaxID=2907625 RepID=UPI001F19BDD1|nr:CHASE2 domain-containing protein [Shewanella sp. AS16]MCE9688265.1 CHASE2 domain-containing protein [Shewanella sp. AS16]